MAIRDLEGITRPSGVTTAALGRRSAPSKKELRDGIRIETRCGDTWCLDGLYVGGRVLISPELKPDEARITRTGWLERVIQVVWQDEGFVSVHVAESEYSGGAHANNSFHCRTFSLESGQALGLRDVLSPRSADLVVAKARRLFKADAAIEELGQDLDAAGFELHPQGFRLGRTDGYKGARPEIILCAEGPYPSRSGEILELRLEAMPVGYLLR